MQTDVVKYFMELIAIDSESKNERAMADRIKADLLDLGAEVTEDQAHLQTGGNAGNIHAWFPGDPSKPAILLCAHLDTVKPGNGVNATITDGRIHTDGTTVLGSDDKSGVAEIMIGIQRALQSVATRCPVEVLFTISEEIGLLGGRLFDMSKLRATMGYALDAHRVGELVVGAPSQNTYKLVINGVEAHAGVEPEKGISAIRVASEAIASMPNGRIDHETTCNIGQISGGVATNIVPRQVVIRGEARSHNPAKLDQVTADILHSVEATVKRYQLPQGTASFEWKCQREYEAIRITPDQPVVRLAVEALESIGIPVETTIGGGGSDANLINAAGIPTIICGTGMSKVHTVLEEILVSELERGRDFIEALISQNSR